MRCLEVIPLIVILFPLFGCSNQNKTASNPGRDPVVVNESILHYNETQSDSSEPPMVFAYRNDTLYQKVEIKYLTSNEISFILTSENIQRGTSSRIEGIAKANNSIDPEIDEDEEGNAYPSQQYVFEKNCLLFIRIDLEQKDKLRVVERNCDKSHDKCCPFSSSGILRKNDTRSR